MELIDKATVVAKIESCISNYKDIVAKTDRNDSTWVDFVSMIDAKIDVLQHLLSFLNTIEVKDVDLEKEIDKWYDTAPDEFEKIHFEHIENCAKHFFELGLKAREGKE